MGVIQVKRCYRGERVRRGRGGLGLRSWGRFWGGRGLGGREVGELW